jgi:hypothetical protein
LKIKCLYFEIGRDWLDVAIHWFSHFLIPEGVNRGHK